MQLSVSGKHIDVGEALRGHVAATLAPTVGRYFGSAIEAKMLFARERHLFRADTAVHIARGMMVHSQNEAPEDPARGHPAIVAEFVAEISTLTVGEAVMRLDLGELPVLMFRNRSHDRLNVVDRRSDGTVGWIDPQVATPTDAA